LIPVFVWSAPSQKLSVERAVTEETVVQQAAEGVSARPRLMIPSNGWEKIRYRIETSERHRMWYQDVKKQAEILLATNPEIGRNTQSDLMNLALVYRMEGGDRYLNKAQEIMTAAYKKPMWNETWTLDQSMVSVGVAVAYDWLYDDLSEAVRYATESNLGRVSLALYLKSFDGGIWWIGADRPGNVYYNNHNGVCNGAALVVASALLDSREFAPRACEAISKGLSSIKAGTLDGLLPDGAWDEGSGYFGYGMTGMVLGLSSVRSSLGTLFGLLDHPGLGKTGVYLAVTTGPVGTMNYGDGTSRIDSSYWMCWLAGAVGSESLATAFRHLQGLENHRGSVLGLCWDDPAVQGGSAAFPLDATFGRIEVGALRANWSSSLAGWAGFKFGRPWQSHAHSDVGTFVYDCDGVRWALDLAGPPYLSNFFSYEDSRYHFYRAKPEGHNTLVINPSGAYQQIIDSDSKVLRVESSPRRGFVVGDMTPAYAKDAQSAHRGFMLDRLTGGMLVQDELVLDKPSEVWWFMHTAAEVELKDGGKAAVLSSNNKTLTLTAVVPDGQVQPVFEATKAKPLPGSRVVAGEYPDEGKITRLALHFMDAKELRFAVSLRPGISTKVPPFISLADWHADAGEKLGLIAKTTETLPGVAEIPLKPEAVRVTEGDAAALLDSDWTTSWSADSCVEENGNKRFVPKSIQIDLQELIEVRAVGLGFETSFQRRYDFRIELSNDGKIWKQVFYGQSARPEGVQRFYFPPQKARYVKIEGLGNENYQNKYNELKLYGCGVGK
jgi:hypothetical protein